MITKMPALFAISILSFMFQVSYQSASNRTCENLRVALELTTMTPKTKMIIIAIKTVINKKAQAEIDFSNGFFITRKTSGLKSL